MPRLRDLELLLCIAKTGSMTAAARQSKLSVAAVSAGVRRVEEELALRIFKRSTRALAPTPEGQTLLLGCQQMLETWQQTLELSQGQLAQLSGPVHIGAPTDTGYGILQELSVQLAREHPELQLVLHAADSMHHLHRDSLDMLVRYGPLEDSSLIARRLAQSPKVLVASPGYIAEFGAPQSPADLVEHRCLALRLSGRAVSQWAMASGEEQASVVLDKPWVGDGNAVRRWAVEGLGIGYKALFDVLPDLKSGRLVPVLPQWQGSIVPIHLITPSRGMQPVRLQVLSEAMRAHFAARQAQMEFWLATSRLEPTSPPAPAAEPEPHTP